MNPSNRSLRTFRFIAVLTGLVSLFPTTSTAQCPGDVYIDNNLVWVSSEPHVDPDPDELYDFIGTGCVTMKFGTMLPQTCAWAVSPMSAVLSAFWPASGDNVTGNGCTFTCDGGGSVCRLRGGDAMPIELLDFSIEPEPAAEK